MHTFDLPLRFGLLMIPLGLIAALVCFVNRNRKWDDYIDEHVGRGGIEDDWGLDRLKDLEH